MQEKKFYKVQAILKHRKIRNKHEYLVKWEGYAVNQATWQPAQNLQYAKDCILDFKSKIKNKEPEKQIEPKLIEEKKENDIKVAQITRRQPKPKEKRGRGRPIQLRLSQPQPELKVVEQKDVEQVFVEQKSVEKTIKSRRKASRPVKKSANKPQKNQQADLDSDEDYSIPENKQKKLSVVSTPKKEKQAPNKIGEETIQKTQPKMDQERKIQIIRYVHVLGQESYYFEVVLGRRNVVISRQELLKDYPRDLCLFYEKLIKIDE